MIVLVGLAAGMITTVAGMGGGTMLVLVLSAWWADPVHAMAVATPALLVGNAHRVWLFRGHVAWRQAAPFIATAVPGALVGGWLMVAVPPLWVQLAMATAAIAAVARHLGRLTVEVHPNWLLPVGLGVGVASSAGGAGLLAGPVLLSAGLSGSAYLATMSLSSLSMHAARLLAFGTQGLVDRPLIGSALVLALCIATGNAVGRRMRRWLGEGWVSHLEVATAAGLVLAAFVGVARVAWGF